MATKIRDERLILRNLKNVRISFLIQTVGIVAVLAFTAVSDGITSVAGDPLWIVLLVSLIVYFSLHLKISLDLRESSKNID